MDHRALKLVVTGGSRISSEVCDIAYAIGRAVVDRGHVMMTGGSSGVDECAARGAFEYLQQTGRDPHQQIISFRPQERRKPHFDYGQVLIAGKRHLERQEKLVQAGDVVLIIAGERGTEHIFDCAIQQHKPVLPVGQTGGTAEEKWKAIQIALDHHYGGRISLLEFQHLFPGKHDPLDIAQWVVKLVERLAHREDLSNKPNGDVLPPPQRIGMASGLPERNKLSGIPSDLYIRLREGLIDCGTFQTDGQLRAIFADAEISPWRDSLPQTGSCVERIEAIIGLLCDRWRSDTGQNALVLLLHVLSQRIDPVDACHQRLADLAAEIQDALAGGLPGFSETGIYPKVPPQLESKNRQPSSAPEAAILQPGDLRLLVFDDRTKQWASQCEFFVPLATPGQKLAYLVEFHLLLANLGSITVRDLVIEMQLASDTDFFLAYEYKSPPLVIEDSPRDWRISKRYDFCEFEGRADFTCHARGRRHLGTVQMLVPCGQPDTTVTFRYRIQAEGYDDQGNFKVILKQGTEQEP